MDKILPRVQTIHNPVLPGAPLLLLPDRVLVRWPVRQPHPALGEPFSGVAVSVPPHLRAAVWTLLFGACAVARCEAARRIADNPLCRRRILHRIYSKSYVQQLLAGADRVQPEQRAQLEAAGQISIRKLTRAARAPTLERRAGPAET